MKLYHYYIIYEIWENGGGENRMKGLTAVIKETKRILEIEDIRRVEERVAIETRNALNIRFGKVGEVKAAIMNLNFLGESEE